MEAQPAPATQSQCDDLVNARSSDQQRLRWHLHDLWPEPAGTAERATPVCALE